MPCKTSPVRRLPVLFVVTSALLLALAVSALQLDNVFDSLERVSGHDWRTIGKAFEDICQVGIVK